MIIDIFFDGGSLNNQSADRQAYGSFMTFREGKVEPVLMHLGHVTTCQHLLMFGNATNNEAEWKTLLAALEYANRVQGGWKPKLDFVFHGDSQLVIGAMSGQSKIKASNLKPLFEHAQELASTIKVTFVKESGERIKEILGH